MGKELSELSLEELWELFPVFLVAHNDEWNIFYDEMESFLKIILSECQVERISHIGSTAISGIWAKDIVDVLIEVSKDSDIWNTAKVIEKMGLFVCQQSRIEYRLIVDIRKTDLQTKFFMYTFAMLETMMNCISEII